MSKDHEAGIELAARNETDEPRALRIVREALRSSPPIVRFALLDGAMPEAKGS